MTQEEKWKDRRNEIRITATSDEGVAVVGLNDYDKNL